MLVIAQHTVLDPEFWQIAASAQIPETLKLHQVAPSADGSRGVCIWEADSVESVRDFVDPAVKHVSRNEYFAVDAGHGLGLPAETLAAQPAV